MNEEDLKELSRKAVKMKSDILFEEPCPFYDLGVDWEEMFNIENDTNS